MQLKRCLLTADFTHHGVTGERTFTAGDRNLPSDAYQAARDAGLIGKPPAAPKAPKAKAAPKAPAKKPAAKKSA